jgi:isochorismate hydrolase
MKERYFKTETMGAAAQSWKEDIYRNLRGPRLRLEISRAALLVLDLQAYFLEPDSHAYIPSAPLILSSLNKIITGMRSCSRPVFLSQHINTPQNAGMMSTWWRDLIREDHPRSGFAAGLAAAEGKILQKTQYDAFYETDLEETLKGAGVSQLIITGVMTHLCCETTARSAFMRGFEVFFPADGTATYNQELHLATLKTLAHGFADIITCGEVLQEIELMSEG